VIFLGRGLKFGFEVRKGVVLGILLLRVELLAQSLQLLHVLVGIDDIFRPLGLRLRLFYFFCGLFLRRTLQKPVIYSAGLRGIMSFCLHPRSSHSSSKGPLRISNQRSRSGFPKRDFLALSPPKRVCFCFPTPNTLESSTNPAKSSIRIKNYNLF